VHVFHIIDNDNGKNNQL